MNELTVDRVAVLFSLSMSLRKWQSMGIFHKEMLIFSEYLRDGVTQRVSMFTYDYHDLEVLQQARKEGSIDDRIDIIVAPKIARFKLGAIIYSLLGPFIQAAHFKNCDAVYTHQSSGAWTGLISKLVHGNRFVYRYGHSLWRRHLDRRQYHRLLLSWPLEQLLLRTSDYALVCTKRDFQASKRQHAISVCPNFIDTERLATITKNDWQRRSSRAAYVGRLMSFKNLTNLIEACAKRNQGLDIYGAGPEEAELKQHAKMLGADCEFKGLVDNVTVRQRLTQYQLFFLVSTYEGMPKSLLEGMASGCLCIVSPHYGCTEIIDHQYNGLVCDGFDTESIAAAITQARQLEDHGFALAAQGQQEVLTRYSLDSVVDIHRVAYGGQSRQLQGIVN